MKKIIRITLVLTLLAFIMPENGFSQVVVRVKPRRPKVVVIKKNAPGKNFVWIGGHWRWSKSKQKYVWVKGKWHKNKKGHVWVDGHWKKVRNGHVWVPGHWRKR